MSTTLQAIRGMNDLLPDVTPYWQKMEEVCRQVASAYGYREIRMPIVEKTALFKRSIGEVTDIVEKEMYSFADRNDDMLSLRPEATAGCVRAALQHGLLHNQVQRFWYQGPMFRRERPQKGRTRQFHQFGVEAFGMADASIDAEIILLNARIWQGLGLQGSLQLQLNSLGTSDCRRAYRQALVEFMQAHHALLDEDSQRRLHTNPLRILDSKNPQVKELVAKAPLLSDYLSPEAKAHFDRCCDTLDACGVSFTINPYLVRGLDYYSHTVFEWVSEDLGAQGTVSAGGRYDRLVNQLGGKNDVPAVGFALGFERLQLLLAQKSKLQRAPHVYWLLPDHEVMQRGLQQAEQCRDAISGLEVEVDLTGASMKTQFKRADRSGARFAIVYGADEVAADAVKLKDLREGGEQRLLPLTECIAFLQKWYDTLQQLPMDQHAGE